MPQPIILTACPPNGSPGMLHIKRKKQSNTDNKKKKERESKKDMETKMRTRNRGGMREWKYEDREIWRERKSYTWKIEGTDTNRKKDKKRQK